MHRALVCSLRAPLDAWFERYPHPERLHLREIPVQANWALGLFPHARPVPVPVECRSSQCRLTGRLLPMTSNQFRWARLNLELHPDDSVLYFPLGQQQARMVQAKA